MILQFFNQFSKPRVELKERWIGLFQSNACIEAHSHHHKKYHPQKSECAHSLPIVTSNIHGLSKHCWGPKKRGLETTAIQAIQFTCYECIQSSDFLSSSPPSRWQIRCYPPMSMHYGCSYQSWLTSNCCISMQNGQATHNPHHPWVPPKEQSSAGNMKLTLKNHPKNRSAY